MLYERFYEDKDEEPGFETADELREHILGLIDDQIVDLLCYDRKEDEDLPRGVIEQAIKDGVISVDDIVAHFRKELSEAVS